MLCKANKTGININEGNKHLIFDLGPEASLLRDEWFLQLYLHLNKLKLVLTGN